MTVNELIEALIPAHLNIRFGKPFEDGEREAASQALREVVGLDGKTRVFIHEQTKFKANACAGVYA